MAIPIIWDNTSRMASAQHHRTGHHGHAVITDLGASRVAERRERERVYVVMMLFRAAFFVAAAVIFHGAARWFAIAVALVLPWVAVILANAPKRLKPPLPRYVPRVPEPHRIEPAKEHRVSTRKTSTVSKRHLHRPTEVIAQPGKLHKP